MVWNLPTGFTTRLGRSAADVFYTGVHQSEGQRIGYLRLGGFPTYSNAQLAQLDAEIAFFNANTDGLVVDVMRNTGGSYCAVSDIARRIVPGSHTHMGLAFRPTISRILAYDNSITQLRGLNAPSWTIELYTYIRNLLAEAYNANRGMPGPTPVCAWDHPFASLPSAYRKPLIALVDDFSTSAGDTFPAVMQDNMRGKIVGTRTNGAGGSVIDVPAGWYGETNTRVTESLVVRPESRNISGFPVSPYIENVGVRPDIELDYMTRENLITAGRPFVEAFTKIIVDEIKKATAAPWVCPDGGQVHSCPARSACFCLLSCRRFVIQPWGNAYLHPSPVWPSLRRWCDRPTSSRPVRAARSAGQIRSQLGQPTPSSTA